MYITLDEGSQTTFTRGSGWGGPKISLLVNIYKVENVNERGVGGKKKNLENAVVNKL